MPETHTGPAPHEQLRRAEVATQPESIEFKTEHKVKPHTPEHTPDVTSLSQEAAGHALPTEQLSTATEHSTNYGSTHHLHQTLKKQTYSVTLRRARQKLSKPEQTVSRFIHQPVIEKSSEVAAKTVARPTSILMGGLVAVVGSSILLFMSKRYGFSYNLTVFGLLFIGGFVAGLLIDGSRKLFAKK